MLLPDHPTPLSVRTHVADPVPFVIYIVQEKKEPGSTLPFDEESAARTGSFISNPAILLMGLLPLADGTRLLDKV